MRIEVGKKYVRRDGLVEEVVSNDCSEDYPFNGASGNCWTANGSFWANESVSGGDLISEYIEPKQTGFVVGETYERADGCKVKCIHIEGDRSYCASVRDGEIFGPAYTWSLDGEYLNAILEDRPHYRITFAPKDEWVKDMLNYDNGSFGNYHDSCGENLNITFPLIDGKPDWSQAKIEAV